MKYAYYWCSMLLLLGMFGFTMPPVTSAAPTQRITIGTSVLGAPIEAFRFGNGTRKFVIVGDTHGGPERNTFVLSNQLIDWFRNHPDAIPSDVRLYIIPTLNPDGERLDTRQNANGVDLNRNMNTNLDACPDNDWSPRVYGAYGVISDTGGAYADSEIESRVIRAFLLDASSVVFLHSAAGLVFPSQCEDPIAIAMAEAYAQAGNYQYARYWDKYFITGGMHDWARGIDLPAIVPELESGDEPEFERNLAGVTALLRKPDAYVPRLSDKVINDMTMPVPIWRFWQAYGAELLGPPLASAVEVSGKFQQDFATIRLEYDPTRDTNAVYALPLTLPPAMGEQVVASDITTLMRFAGTDAVVQDAFATYYQRTDSSYLLGAPRDNERLVKTDGDNAESQQQFTFGVIRYNEPANRVERVPVVWQQVVVQQLRAPTQSFQIR